MLQRLDWPRLRDQAIVVVCSLAVFWAAGQVLSHFLRIVVLLLLAVVLAFVLEPPVARLERLGVPRWMAALTIYLATAGSIGALLWIFGRSLAMQATAFAKQLPGYLDSTASRVEQAATANGLPVSPPAGGATGQLGAVLPGGGHDILNTSINAATLVGGSFVDAILVLVIAFYFVVDGRRMRGLFVALVPQRHREKVLFVEAAINQVVGSYIRGQLILAAIIGVAAGAGCWALGVRYPLVIAVLAFFFELVPMLGPVLTAVPAVVIAVFQPFPLVLYVIAYFVAVQMAENHILAPRISGHAVGLHPVVALIALIAGADLFGVWGALFAVPLAGVMAVLASAGYKAARGLPVVVERGRMRIRMPRRGKRPVVT